MTRLIFLDTETTGLDPDRHEVWEVAWIIRDESRRDDESAWQLPLRWLGDADPYALRVGRFHDRYRYVPSPVAVSSSDGARTSEDIVARSICQQFDGATIVGAVPDFDVRFLTRWLARQGFPWTAHYHLCDVENLAVGYLRRQLDELSTLREVGEAYSPHEALARILDPPWSSDALSAALGIEIAPKDRHTALGDARWARDLYDAVMS